MQVGKGRNCSCAINACRVPLKLLIDIASNAEYRPEPPIRCLRYKQFLINFSDPSPLKNQSSLSLTKNLLCRLASVLLNEKNNSLW
jgi:hypothetical protein